MLAEVSATAAPACSAADATAMAASRTWPTMPRRALTIVAIDWPKVSFSLVGVMARERSPRLVPSVTSATSRR
ncbi:hypothetical protein D3C72_2549010 [compost metagenome]